MALRFVHVGSFQMSIQILKTHLNLLITYQDPDNKQSNGLARYISFDMVSIGASF